jgi:hypothetical protein
MTWIGKLKNKSFEIIFGMFIIGLPVFFSTSIVDQFITPRIVENLKKEQYLREDLKEGRYVVTDEISFANNNVIQGDVIQELNADLFAKTADLKVISDQVGQLEVSVQNELEKTSISLTKANKEIEALNHVIQALASKELDIALFISDIDSDKGFVVLNIHNKAISQIIENDKKYYIYNDLGGSLKLRSRVEPAPAENYNKSASVGRLHRDDYHELFSGTKSGVRIAKIKID